MAAAAMMPVLLEDKQPSLATSLVQLPVAVSRQLVKQVQWLLSFPNKQLGKPFLQGNFAPIHSEVFTQNLPLVTADSSSLHTQVHTKIHTKEAAENGSAANGVHAAPYGEDGENDVDAVRDTTAASSGSSSSPKLYGASSLPDGLSGVFLRIGPNPLLQPLGGYHWFDGDGMVHAVRIKDGKASYCNRWVPTSRLEQEAAAGWPMFIKLGDYVGVRGLGLILLERVKTLMGVVDKTSGGGTANTAMVCHASRLLALNEGDMPYALRVMCNGLLEAVGRVTVTGPVGKSFTAHPKLDPITGELHFFRYTFDAAPYATYGVLGPQGDLLRCVPITAANLARPIMMHDFAITRNYAVFLDNPLCFDGERMVKQGNLPFAFKADQGSRVGLLRRDAADDSAMMWFTLPAHMVFHVVNAWEQADGTVKLFVCHSETISLNLDTRTDGSIPEGEQPRVAVITLDPAATADARVGSLALMTKTAGDFPTINPRFVGSKQRWAYVATMVTGFGAAVKWDGVAKVDLWAGEGEEAAVAKIQLPPGCYNGETMFVPRHEDPSLCAGEDDGYLITFVHDETANPNTTDNSSSSSSGSSGSSLVIWDAGTMSQQPLAVVALPQRVPYGFHALWVPETAFQQQLKGRPLMPNSAAV